MTGTRISDLPRALASRLKYGDWRGLYTRPSRIEPDRWSADTIAVLKQADAEVRSRGHRTLGTQHLLLGFLHAGNARLEVAFAAGGLPIEQLVEAIDGQLPPGEVVWDPPEPVKPGETVTRPRFVGATRRVIDTYERAFQMADRRGADQVDAHLLLAALVTDRRATAARLLRRAGVNLKALKRASLESG